MLKSFVATVILAGLSCASAPAAPLVGSATMPAFFVNFVASGAAASGVPCVNCIPGASGTTLGLPIPYNYVPTGTTQNYTVTLTDLSYTGTCTFSIAITAGTQKLDSASYKVKVSAPGPYVYTWNRPRPTYSGSAFLTGKVTCAGASSSAKSTLIFQ